MTILGLHNLLTSIVSLFLGEYVYTRNPGNRLNRMFFLFSLGMAYWGFGGFGFQQSETSEIAHIWLRVGALWPIVIALSLHFILISISCKESVGMGT